MANKAKETEHAGAKKGSGAFYGPKAEAKKGSNHDAKRLHQQLAQSMISECESKFARFDKE